MSAGAPTKDRERAARDRLRARQGLAVLERVLRNLTRGRRLTIELSDLRSVAHEALAEAIATFETCSDPKFGRGFLGYAGRRIRWAMIDEYRRITGWRRKQSDVQKLSVNSHVRRLSLDALCCDCDGGGVSFGEMLVDPHAPDPRESATLRDDARALWFEGLGSRERRIAFWFIERGETNHEIAGRLRVSRARVSQLLNRVRARVHANYIRSIQPASAA